MSLKKEESTIRKVNAYKGIEFLPKAQFSNPSIFVT